MIRVREVIVVEGKYDKNTLSQTVDAAIVETHGFGVFKDRERLELIRAMARRRGIIVFTDSDGAGFVIRNFLRGAVPPEQIKHAYIPDVYGKEKRKSSPSKEGKLGLEGMGPEVIIEALRRAGATIEGETSGGASGITSADMFALGLSGRPDSAARRAAVLRELRLPERMTGKAMLSALNVLMDREELSALMAALDEHDATGGETK